MNTDNEKPIQLLISDKRLIEISTSWDGTLDVKTKVKPLIDSDYQFENGFNLSKRSAENLALILLERVDATHMLMKKFRPS